MNKYITEAIGTFFLVAAIGLTGSPLAIAATLLAMIYAGGYLSGAHYNPAVTVALWLRKIFPTSDILPYIGAQLVGAILASFVVLYLKGAAADTLKLDIGKSLLVEFIFTFALVLVILNVATTKKNVGNEHYGLSIAFVVLGIATAGGSISGGAYNPAVAVSLAVMGIIAWADIWIHLTADLAGAAFAVSVFWVLHADEKQK